MKKTRLKQRIKNAAEAFFADDRADSGENSLTSVRDAGLLTQETTERFHAKGDLLVKILKRALLFLPGAFYLFFGTLSVFTFELLRERPLAILAAFLVGSLMTIFGIGNTKNPKYFMIPLSVIAVATFAFVFFSVLGISKYVFEYGIYFFPLALTLPFLARGLADKMEREKVGI